MKAHVLTHEGTPNSRAFNFPLKVNRSRLREHGIHLRFFKQVEPALLECDLLLINSKFYSPLLTERDQEIFADLTRYREQGIRLAWFDTSDSTYIYQGPVLPYVDRFYKAQLLVDRQQYKQSPHGGRVFTGCIHEQLGVTDESDPYPATPLSDEEIGKLGVSWHSGLGEYGWRRFYRVTRVTSAIRDSLGQPYRYHPRFCIREERPLDISCRVGLGHSRETIRRHREEIIDRLRARDVDTSRIKPWRYWREMCRSKIGVSPFGLGEISLRDFEVFLCGALLFKPAMEHLQTWPPLYEPEVTYVGHRWDLKDFDEQLDRLLANPERLRQIRVQGIERYRHYLSEAGQQAFCQRVAEIVEELG